VNRLIASILTLVVLAIAGCGGSSSPTTPIAGPVGLLSPVADAATLEASLKSGFTNLSSAEDLSFAADVSGIVAQNNFTGTYTQELNVDEFDAVRYDGAHLYVAPRRYYNCCFLLDAASTDGATNTGKEPQRSIRILSTDPDNADAQLVSRIPLEENISVQGMYVAGERMVALTGQSIYGSYGSLWATSAMPAIQFWKSKPRSTAYS